MGRPDPSQFYRSTLLGSLNPFFPPPARPLGGRVGLEEMADRVVQDVLMALRAGIGEPAKMIFEALEVAYERGYTAGAQWAAIEE